jgi:DNA-binding NarL/FixJ family response regulator
MRILLADDHPLFAEALQTLIERAIPASSLTVVGDLDGTQRALAAPPRFDLAILDLHMPGSDGLAGIESILRSFPETPLMVISGSATPQEVARAIELGAKGFLPKTLTAGILTAALQLVAAGGTYVPADYFMPASPGGRPGGETPLTPREIEVLAHLAAGGSNKEIGRALGLQEITVKLHVRNIFRKLGVRNRVEAANAAARLDLAPTRA